MNFEVTLKSHSGMEFEVTLKSIPKVITCNTNGRGGGACVHVTLKVTLKSIVKVTLKVTLKGL